MIPIFFLLINTLDNFELTFVEKSNEGVHLKISFNDSKVEPVCIGFVLSPAPPVFQYSLVDFKSAEGSILEPYSSPIEIGRPIKLRGYNLFPVILNPVFKTNNKSVILQKMEIKLFFARYLEIKLPPSLARVYKNLIINYDYNYEDPPQGLLIITPNSFYNSVLPLADWKEKKGWKVTIARLSETGNTADGIKNYIANAYYNWNPRPEYVILVGDKDSLPTFDLPGTPIGVTDHPYTLIEGNDFFSDLLIGRLSVVTSSELNIVISKILGYEKNPYTTDTLWFKRALMVGANYPAYMTTPLPTKEWVRQKMRQNWYIQVDTVYYPPTANGQVPITNSVNQGVTFINYRGGIASPTSWDYPYFSNADIQGLTNNWKLPIVTDIVCYHGNFNNSICFGEAWLRAGVNPTTPKGAVGFFGSSYASTSSRWNNCLDYGIYWGLLEDSIYYFGPMTYRGKMEVYLNFPLETAPDTGSGLYFHCYNVLGDPSLEIWTGVPQNFIVTHQSTIPVGTNSFSVQVLNSSSQPVKDAMVSLYKKNETKGVEFTDESGMANFQITTSTPDTLFVTVTKHNFRPYCGYALVNNSSVYVGYYNHTISDPGGNNNGEINPGENIQLGVTLKNFGNSTTANNVSAKLTTNDQSVTIIDSMKSYGNITPGATASASPYLFNVSQSIKNNHLIKCNLSISSTQGNWNSVLWLTAKAPEFEYQRHQVLDGGNGVLEPGETSDMIISLKNIGGLGGTNIQGILRSKNPGVSVIDSLGSFGNIGIGDSATNSTDHFQVSASSQLAPGHIINFSCLVSGDNNFKDTVDFSITIGVVSTNSPTGPDGYGYYAYDDTDVSYPEAPTYNWIEIDPDLGGQGTILNLLNDETRTINLPFIFKYYGVNYNKISICSNGYIAMDSTWIADMYNWRILSAGGPPLLIASFWDDLDPNATDSSGNVCYYYDAINHRFIIEWSRVQHIHNPTNPTPAELQTFEIVLFDPNYYPTQTGDGEILFQYKKITNDDQWHNYATVGIEDKNHINGLEYTYANIYPPSAAPLINNRAIKFTTDQPDPYPGIGEDTRDRAKDAGLEIHPNPFRDVLKIKFSGALHNQKSGISLKIYNSTGRLVKSFDHQTEFMWDGCDDLGRRVPAGVYFIEIDNNKEKSIKKAVLLR